MARTVVIGIQDFGTASYRICQLLMKSYAN